MHTPTLNNRGWMQHWAGWMAVVVVVGCGQQDPPAEPTGSDAQAAIDSQQSASADSSDSGTEAGAAPDIPVIAEDIAVPPGPDAAPLHPAGPRGLCDPCGASADCSDPMASCVGLGNPAGAHGWFCQAPCAEDGTCPAGAHCESRSTTEGEVILSCVPDSQQCACSAATAQAGWNTPCFIPSLSDEGLVVGKCAGQWTCAAGGCSAQPPAKEVCNGKDDDCDGQTDEEPAGSGAAPLCDDGDPCTLQESCAQGQCTAGVSAGCTCQQDGDCAGKDVCLGQWFCNKASLPWQCEVKPQTQPDCSGLPTAACTQAKCDPSKGCVVVAKPAGSACDADGDPCTAADSCAKGSCLAGTAVTCDDGNPCTYDGCGKAGCSHVTTTGACDDGNACTAKDVCKKGACVGTASGCSDGNPCTSDFCDPKTGQCSGLPGNDSGSCDDADPCTAGDSCKAGACQGGAAVGCDDSNPCTQDLCQPGKGCSHAPSSGSCDDSNPCTQGDTCAQGECKGGPSQCGCQKQADCDAQQAADPCLGAMICNLVANPPACVPKPGAAALCQGGGPCEVAQCKQGKCSLQPKADGASCDDGSPCTTADACKAGSCGGKGLSCDDGNPCTADSCSTAAGSAQCLHSAQAGPCSDGVACTSGDSCVSGKCAPGPAKDCSDGSACTVDSCVATTGACAHDAAPLQGKVCGTGQGVCGPATCSSGTCTLQLTSACDDGNLCTDDSCVSDVGCVHKPNAIGCDDGNPCTAGDVCGSGKCAGTKPTSCDDSNPCTDDACSKAQGCSHTANTLACDDGDLCSEADVCTAGLCKGKKKNCGDGNPCTVSTCTLGVCSAPALVPDGTLCKGKGSCNGQAACKAGNCVDPPESCPSKKGREIVPLTIPEVFGKAKTLFDPVGVHEVKLTVSESDWTDYMALVAKKQKGTTWWPAAVTFDGKDYGEVGIRPFGFGSLNANPNKPNIRVKFDAIVDGKDGPDDVHSLRFKPSGQDNTWLKQILGPMIVQQIGGYGPRYSWARLWINGEAHGLYQLIEHVDKHFYKVNFGNDEGNEYQRKSSCMGLNCPGGICANLAGYYIGDPGAATEVVALGTAVQSAPDATWPTALEGIVDLSSLLAQYAWEAISSDIDTLAAAGQNYTLYMNQETARMEFIPTGEDLVLGFKNSWYDLWAPWGPPNTWCKNRVDNLYARIVATPALKAKLTEVMQKAHCGPFSVKTFVPMIQAYKKLLWVDLTQDPKGILTPTQIDTAYTALIDYVVKRNAYLDTTVGLCPAN